MALTAAAIHSAKPGAKPYKVTDRDGLFLLVNPNGSKLWRLRYRLDGKEKKLSIGAYPEVGLSDARDRAAKARKQLAQGLNPQAEKDREKLTAKLSRENTFRAVADEWLAKQAREGRADATMEKNRWLLELAYAALGSRPIAEITAPELLSVLRKVEARGRHETARRLRAICGTLFRYAIATGRAERDVAADLKGALTATKVKPFAAILDPKAVGGLLRAIDGFEGQPSTHAALRLAPLVFQRPGELRHMEWGEIDFDKAQWLIPAEKTKMRRSHRVPLSAQVLGILRDIQRLTGAGQFCFPCARTVRRPISENTLNAALRRLGYGKDEMTSHGFRAMASSLLNESGLWNPDAIERQLAHADTDAIRAAYHRGEHWDERVKMMQWWADYLNELKAGAKIIEWPARR
jgi:integrase